MPGGRDGLLYVPQGYHPGQATPLMILLHGATQSSELWTRSDSLLRLADEDGVVLLLPNSVSNSWDLMRGGFGPDVARLDSALAQVFGRLNIDAARIAFSWTLRAGAASGKATDLHNPRNLGSHSADRADQPADRAHAPGQRLRFDPPSSVTTPRFGEWP